MPTYKCLSLEEFRTVVRSPNSTENISFASDFGLKLYLRHRYQLGDGKQRVAVIFYLTYCGYCQQMLSLFRDQAEQAVYSKSYDIFVEVDCDEQPDIQHYYGIKMVGIFWAHFNQRK